MGKSLADEFFKPFSVIDLTLLVKLNVLTSVGVYHCIFPFQYSGFDVEGVPPPINSPISPSFFSIQSPSFWKSGKRYFGTFSPSLGKRFCIRPFLWSFRASSFSLWAVIRLSRDERQEAIFCCSWGEGWAIDNLENTDIQWRL